MNTHRKTWLILAAALGMSWLVVFNTMLVTANNLGAREDIGYINGGKVFRLQGTMWYHIPGLLDLGLAPQNIGGQINLRNNEFAMLERDLRSVKLIDLDIALQENAMLLVILNRHQEGSFWAVRLTAFNDPNTSFVNALIRYEQGQVVERIALSKLKPQLSTGEHQVQVELIDSGSLKVTVDDQSETVPFRVHDIRPSLALGSGELNTTISRWRVVGIDEDGKDMEWEEDFSVIGTLFRSLKPLTIITSLVWLLFLGFPLAKVFLETRTSPLALVPAVLLRPLPRTVFGVVCLVPWTSMVIQWVLGGLYVVYAWLSLWEAYTTGKQGWGISEEDSGDKPWKWVAVGSAIILFAMTLLAMKGALYSSIIGSDSAEDTSQPVIKKTESRGLTLGERISLNFENLDEEVVRVKFRVNLDAQQILRADLLEAAPPKQTDVYQVDRNQDPKATNSDMSDNGDQSDENMHPGDYSLKALSVLVSTDQSLPGQLRWLFTDKVARSPNGGWVLDPGKHTVEITCFAPIATVAIDGKIVDFRTDVPRSFRPKLLQLLSQSPSVRSAGDISVSTPAPGTVEATVSRIDIGLLLGLAGLLLVIYGGALLILGVVTQLPFSRTTLVQAIQRITKAHVLFLFWMVWWMVEQLGWINLAGHKLEIALALGAILAGTFNLAQILKQTHPNRQRWQQITAVCLLGLFVVGTFEGVSKLYPEKRHNWTTYWHHQLSPQHYWVHDPMIRRLNPWFIDMRFKRRDWKADHKDKTRVVVFGGSQTYGWGIPAMDRMTFSDQLERILHQRGHTNVEVLNAAFPGVKTATGLRWFASNLLRYQPDVVVINFVVNEFMNTDPYHIWAGEHGNDELLSPLALPALMKRFRGDLLDSHLFQIIVAVVYEVYEMEQYLTWWVEMARKHNIKVVFSIEPTNLYVESGGQSIMREETQEGAAQQTYRNLGQALNVPVFDVLPHFLEHPENMWFYDTMHMSRLGHRVFAEHLATLLQSQIFNPQSAQASE